MRPLLKIGTRSASSVNKVRTILAANGYDMPPAQDPDYYDSALAEVVRLFQAQHTDEKGRWLATDGVVGPNTWWALDNPSGKAQAGPAPTRAKVVAPTTDRSKVVAKALEWFRLGVREKPNGSNWGGYVSEILGNLGKPAPWCAFFISFIFRLALGRYPNGKYDGYVAGMWADAAKIPGARQPVGNGYVPRPGDVGVILYTEGGKRTGAGHVFFVVAVAKGTALGYSLETVGGNEGNQVKLSRRDTWRVEDFVGFINYFGDAETPYKPEGLRYTQGAVQADDSAKGTR